MSGSLISELISELIKFANEWNLLYFYEVELPRW